MAYESQMTPRHHAFIAADRTKWEPHASAKFYSVSSDNVPVVIDSGASTSVTPFFDDFVGKFALLEDHKVDGITEEAIIEGVGEVEWTVYDHYGNKGLIRTLCYYMPKAKIRLFSPQTYLRNN